MLCVRWICCGWGFVWKLVPSQPVVVLAAIAAQIHWGADSPSIVRLLSCLGELNALCQSAARQALGVGAGSWSSGLLRLWHWRRGRWRSCRWVGGRRWRQWMLCVRWIRCGWGFVIWRLVPSQAAVVLSAKASQIHWGADSPSTVRPPSCLGELNARAESGLCASE